jgi:hypothetical protein
MAGVCDACLLTLSRLTENEEDRPWREDTVGHWQLNGRGVCTRAMISVRDDQQTRNANGTVPTEL